MATLVVALLAGSDGLLDETGGGLQVNIGTEVQENTCTLLFGSSDFHWLRKNLMAHTDNRVLKYGLPVADAIS